MHDEHETLVNWNIIANGRTQLPTHSANQEQTLLINYKFSIASELRNRNIIRVCMENLSIVI